MTRIRKLGAAFGAIHLRRKLRRIMALGLTVVFLLPFLFPRVRAAQPDCQFDNQLKNLSVLQNSSSGDYLEDLRAELKVRKVILNQVVDCSLSEVSGLQSAVKAPDINNPADQNLRTQFLNKLDDVINYYQIQKSKINDLGLKGSKDFARDLKDWRASNYSPLAQQTANFIIWVKNQELIQTAQNRFNQLKQSLLLFKLNDSDKVKVLLQKAETDFQNSLKANDQAREDLKSISQPNEALESIKSSLDFLASTYQDFFDITEAIKGK